MNLGLINLNNKTIKNIINRDIYKVSINSTLMTIKHLLINKSVKKILVIDDTKLEEIPITFITANNIIYMDYNEMDLNDFINNIEKKINYCLCEEDKFDKVFDLIINKNYDIVPVKSEGMIVGYISHLELFKIINKNYFNCNDIFSLILDKINNAICLVDKNCNVRYWNETAERLYNINKSEIIGKEITTVFPNALLPKVIEEKKIYKNVYNSPRVDNNDIISASPLYKNGEIIGAISSDMEVSELIKISDILSKSKYIDNFEKEVLINSDNIYFSNIVGEERNFKEAVNFAKGISKAKINVLLIGESGTGKELFANAIHTESGRKGRFVAINCSAIPINLMESELFGYEAGSFTGALKKGKIGKFEVADEGTIFLDEIGDMPMYMQPKILRFLEDGVITRVGSDKSKKINVRVVAATNQNLKKLIDKNLFRKDLYYRLNSILIELPPLRERKSDIPILINKFIETFSIKHRINIVKIPDDIVKVLLSYEWDGNIRELKNVVERIVVLSKNSEVDISFLPQNIIENKGNKIPNITYNNLKLDDIISYAEKDALLKAMKLARGNKAKAAKILDIPRSTLYFKLDRYGLRV